MYNQGNNRRTLFYSEDDHQYFLSLFRKRVLPYAEVLAWCLMPNHFHILLVCKAEGAAEKRIGNVISTELGNAIRLMQSQYAQYLNQKQGNSGSVFRQKVKMKLLERGEVHYPWVCFHYIHQNPLRAGLVNKLEDWRYGSYLEYTTMPEEGICNRDMAIRLLDINPSTFAEDSQLAIPEDKLKVVRPTFP